MPPIESGLVVRLETDQGVAVDAGVVQSWSDGSGSGNDLTAEGNPVLGALTPSGASAIVFDGEDDLLQRNGLLAGLPDANADRTVFVVVDYGDPEAVYSGFSYGDGAANEAFGLVTNGQGALTVQGWGGGNDFASGVDGVGGGFIVQSVVLDDDTISHYRNGALIDTDTHVFATDAQSMVIGAEIAGLGESQMAVSAVLVYDRALNQTERAEVEAYLQEKYLAVDGNVTPLAVDDSAGVTPGGATQIDLLANDTDDAPLTGNMITIVDGPDHGTLSGIDPNTGLITYTHDGGASVSDTFSYTLTDAGGVVSDPATVTVNIGEQPLSLEGFSDELVVTRGDLGGSFFLPISMEFLPDNRMLLLSKSGEIRIVDPETGANSQLMRLTNIDSGQERGLLDITLDPDFADNGYFYLYYTPANPQHTRVSRFTFEENAGGLTSTASTASEFVVWQDTDGYPSSAHYGGGVDFGIDGKIWVSTADKFQSTTPGEGDGGGSDPMLDLASGSGKVIRVNKDGTVPDGSDGWPANPFIDGPGGNHDFVWAYGLRNPFRASWDLEYGHFYMAEVGGNQQLIAHEDLHLAGLDQPGVFYGWPFYEGTPNTYVNDDRSPYDLNDFPLPDNDLGDPANDDEYSAPIWSLPHDGLFVDGNLSASITGGEVYRGSLFPDEWDGVYFFGDYTRDTIRYLKLDETGTEVLGAFDFKPSAELPGSTNEIVALSVGTDGALYYAMISSGEVRRIVYEGNEAPEIASVALDVTEGDPPLAVVLTAEVSDPEGDALTYSVNFADGTVVNGTVPPNGVISVDHTYDTDGRYAVSLSVSDGARTALSQVIEVEVGEVNDAPEISGESADVSIGEANVTEVTFTSIASDDDGDALTYTWHFGDGTTTSGAVGPGGLAEASHVYAEDGIYRAYVEISDGVETTTSNTVSVQIGTASQIPVTSGLSLLLESDIKIGLGQGDTVVSWLDASGNGNNLTGTGNPQLVAGLTPSGRPAIVFDGVGDTLQRRDAVDGLFNLSEGNEDRSIFVVIDYDDPEGVYSGVSYGSGTPNGAFGLVADASGDLTVQGWGGGNDFSSGRAGVAGGFMVQSVTLMDGVTSHFRNGVLIDSDAHTFATDVETLILGGEIAGLGESELKIAAVLVYNRAVSDAERAQIEDFLQTKYLDETGNADPVAVDDNATTTEDFAVRIDVMANDSDADSDALSLVSVSAPSNGTAVIVDPGTPGDPSDDEVRYRPQDGFSGEDTFTYTIADGNGGTDEAEVTVTVTSSRASGVPITLGLVAAYEADENVSLAQGNRIEGWLDGSGFGNDLLAEGDPRLVQNATPTGEAAIVFDGNDFLERVAPGNSLSALPDGSDDRTVFFVADYIDPEGVWAGISYGNGAPNEAFGIVSTSWGELAVQGWGSGNDLPSGESAVDGGFSVQSAVLSDDVISLFSDGDQVVMDERTYDTALERLVIGAEIAGLGEAQLSVAAVFIYDRALSMTERTAVEDYLYDKYVDDILA